MLLLEWCPHLWKSKAYELFSARLLVSLASHWTTICSELFLANSKLGLLIGNIDMEEANVYRVVLFGVLLNIWWSGSLCHTSERLCIAFSEFVPYQTCLRCNRTEFFLSLRHTKYVFCWYRCATEISQRAWWLGVPLLCRPIQSRYPVHVRQRHRSTHSTGVR
jgi:hypothetical protein